MSTFLIIDDTSKKVQRWGVGSAGCAGAPGTGESEVSQIPLPPPIAADEHLLWDDAASPPEAVVAAGALVSPLKLDLCRATNHTDHRQVNYKTGLICRLFKSLATVFRGEVRRIEYFSDEAKTDLVLFVVVAYTRDASGLAVDRTTTRTWKRQDDTDHPQKKITKKNYDNFHAAKESNRRRGNVIGQLKIDVLMMIIATTAVDPAEPTQAEVDAANVTGITYLSKYQDPLNLYVETGDLSFKTTPASPNITDDVEGFLDNNVTAYGWTGPTIRDEILNALQEIDA